MCVCIHIHIHIIYIYTHKELAHTILEFEKSQDLQLASWRPRTDSCKFLSKGRRRQCSSSSSLAGKIPS